MNTEQTSKNIFTYISFWKPFFYIQRLHSACSTKDDISINVTSKTGLVWNKRQGKLVTVFNWLEILKKKYLPRKWNAVIIMVFLGSFWYCFWWFFRWFIFLVIFKSQKKLKMLLSQKKKQLNKTKQNRLKQIRDMRYVSGH